MGYVALLGALTFVLGGCLGYAVAVREYGSRFDDFLKLVPTEHRSLFHKLWRQAMRGRR